MLYINNKPTGILPLLSFGKKKDKEVDKGSNRDTPGDSDGARPPKKEEYKNSQKKKKTPESADQQVDNEEKDKNKTK